MAVLRSLPERKSRIAQHEPLVKHFTKRKEREQSSIGIESSAKMAKFASQTTRGNANNALEQEGIEFESDKIDLRNHLWEVCR